jgi:hypothetical protein
LKRKEAVALLKELIDSCPGLDGHPLEITPPNIAKSTGEGYQVLIVKALDQETKNCVISIVTQHQLAYQMGIMWKTRSTKTEPDTFIIYKKKK